MLFDQLDHSGYKKYLENNPFHLDLRLDLTYYGNYSEKDLSSKMNIDLWEPVDPTVTKPKPAEMDDLIRLHYLVTARKITTVLEFGVGMSTAVFDHALSLNKKKYGAIVKRDLRRSNPFELHSVDDSAYWIEETKKRFNFNNTFFHLSDCEMNTFNGRICTFYKSIPNICPDLIYLDGPDQFSVSGEVRGISTRNSDRVPMSGDILAIEHFLLPGTIIIVDGRTANARFLQTNLQRNWDYTFFEGFDQHIFELIEEPLGSINAKHISFSKLLSDL
jgi:hypothetical protein